MNRIPVRSFFLALYLCVGMVRSALSQSSFILTLAGTPNNTKDWVVSGESYAYNNGDFFVLNNPFPLRTGYVMTKLPFAVTPESKFTAMFEMQFFSFSDTVGDGMAFWFLTKTDHNMPAAGLGIPANPEGLVLAFDIFDNNKDGKNPVVSLRGCSGKEKMYNENGSSSVLDEAGGQHQLTDTAWHQVRLQYDKGNIAVFLDNKPEPLLQGKYPMNYKGYFGFSSSAGKYSTKFCTRNVVIVSSLMPPGMTGSKMLNGR
ncbi:hypothetical protein ACTHGU_21840 [Chitinophagaceae bacterium MMS25-I14]